MTNLLGRHARLAACPTAFLPARLDSSQLTTRQIIQTRISMRLLGRLGVWGGRGWQVQQQGAWSATVAAVRSINTIACSKVLQEQLLVRLVSKSVKRVFFFLLCYLPALTLTCQIRWNNLNYLLICRANKQTGNTCHKTFGNVTEDMLIPHTVNTHTHAHTNSSHKLNNVQSIDKPNEQIGCAALFARFLWPI